MKTRCIILISISILIGSCNSSRKEFIKYNGFAQGTTFSIKFYASKDSTSIIKGIDSILYEINRTASTYDSTSTISKVNKNQDVESNYDFTKIFNRSIEISNETHGCFDITVGKLVKRWGFGFKTTNYPTEKEVKELLSHIGYQKVSIHEKKVVKEDPAIQLDFNAIAQGYTVDLVAEYLLRKGHNDFIVEIGGEVRANGTKLNGQPWIVGIEKPALNDSATQVVQEKVILKNKAISTSGNYRKFFMKDGIKYSHTIDPKTGYPVHHSLLSVSIIANDCTTADAYCTAFMVMGLDKAKEFIKTHPEFKAYFIYADSINNNQIYYTEGFFEQTQ